MYSIADVCKQYVIHFVNVFVQYTLYIVLYSAIHMYIHMYLCKVYIHYTVIHIGLLSCSQYIRITAIIRIIRNHSKTAIISEPTTGSETRTEKKEHKMRVLSNF